MPATDHDIADQLAAEAGRRLVALRARGGDPGALRRDGDQGSHEFLVTELARLRPADAVLSEEGSDDAARLSRDRVWIVDPLDGTREFGEAGRTDWAVHVALWQSGQLTAGAVALPAQGIVLSTARELAPAAGAGTAGEAGTATTGAATTGAGPGNGRPLRIVVSRTRAPEFVHRVASQLGAELVPMGSAGAKAAAVIRGEADAYLHGGGQYEWDSAAPVAVARAAGLHASRIDGSELRYNQPAPELPDLLICRAALAGPLLDAIGTA